MCEDGLKKMYGVVRVVYGLLPPSVLWMDESRITKNCREILVSYFWKVCLRLQKAIFTSC